MRAGGQGGLAHFVAQCVEVRRPGRQRHGKPRAGANQARREGGGECPDSVPPPRVERCAGGSARFEQREVALGALGGIVEREPLELARHGGGVGCISQRRVDAKAYRKASCEQARSGILARELDGLRDLREGRFQGSLCREKPRPHDARRHTASPIDQIHGVGPPALPVETLAKLRHQFVGRLQSFDSLRFDRAPQQCLGPGKLCIVDPCCRERGQQWHRRRALVVARRTVRSLFPCPLGFEHAAAAGTRGCQCGPDRRAGGVPPSLESSRLASQCPARPCATAASFIQRRSRENPRDGRVGESPDTCVGMVQWALVHLRLR